MIKRDVELEGLYDLVMTRESLVLRAPSGMGKTHISKLLQQKLESRRICFHMSLRGLGSESDLLQQLLASIEDEARERSNLQYQIKRLLSEHPAPADPQPENLKKWVEHLLVGLQSVSLDFLFVFEDVDEWEGKSSLHDLLVFFFRSRNSQALLTTSTGHQFEELIEFRLPPLDIQKLKPAYLDNIDQERIEEVLAFSAGNTRLFLELMEEGALRAENPQQCMNAVIERYHGVYYLFRWRFTDLQWRLLHAIAQEEKVTQPHSFAFLVKYELGAASSVERAIKNLCDTKVICKSEAGWQVSHILFQRWLQWLYSARQPVMA